MGMEGRGNPHFFLKSQILEANKIMQNKQIEYVTLGQNLDLFVLAPDAQIPTYAPKCWMVSLADAHESVAIYIHLKINGD